MGQPIPSVPNYQVEAPSGDLSPPLVSEDAAHDWAAVNRRGQAYVVHVKVDGQAIAKKRHPPRPR